MRYCAVINIEESEKCKAKSSKPPFKIQNEIATSYGLAMTHGFTPRDVERVVINICC